MREQRANSKKVNKIISLLHQEFMQRCPVFYTLYNIFIQYMNMRPPLLILSCLFTGIHVLSPPSQFLISVVCCVNVLLLFIFCISHVCQRIKTQRRERFIKQLKIVTVQLYATFISVCVTVKLEF